MAPDSAKILRNWIRRLHTVPLHQCDEESEDQRLQVQAGLAKRCNSCEAEGLSSFSTARELLTKARDALKCAPTLTPGCVSADGRLVRRAKARRLHGFLQNGFLQNGFLQNGFL